MTSAGNIGQERAFFTSGDCKKECIGSRCKIILHKRLSMIHVASESPEMFVFYESNKVIALFGKKTLPKRAISTEFFGFFFRTAFIVKSKNKQFHNKISILCIIDQIFIFLACILGPKHRDFPIKKCFECETFYTLDQVFCFYSLSIRSATVVKPQVFFQKNLRIAKNTTQYQARKLLL